MTGNIINDTNRTSGGILSLFLIRSTSPGMKGKMIGKNMVSHNLNIRSHWLFAGGLAVAVPGEVKGLYAAWEMFGRVPWKELYAPSIRLCEKGVAVVPALAHAISIYTDLILNDSQLR